MAWTEHETEILRLLWAEGLPANKIEKALKDKSRASIMGKAHRLGLTARTQKDAISEKIELLELFAQDGLRQIDDLLEGVSQRSSNQPSYAEACLEAAKDLRQALESFSKAIEDAYNDRSNITTHHLKRFGKSLGKGIEYCFSDALAKLKKEGGFIALVGMIGYMLTLTGNETLAATVVALLLGKELASQK